MANIAAPARGFRPTAAPVRTPAWSIPGAGQPFQFRWDPKTWVNATIAPDGTITGGAESITLVGRRTGPTIQADVTNGNCGLHVTVIRHS